MTDDKFYRPILSAVCHRLKVSGWHGVTAGGPVGRWNFQWSYRLQTAERSDQITGLETVTTTFYNAPQNQNVYGDDSEKCYLWYKRW